MPRKCSLITFYAQYAMDKRWKASIVTHHHPITCYVLSMISLMMEANMPFYSLFCLYNANNTFRNLYFFSSMLKFYRGYDNNDCFIVVWMCCRVVYKCIEGMRAREFILFFDFIFFILRYLHLRSRGTTLQMINKKMDQKCTTATTTIIIINAS